MGAPHTTTRSGSTTMRKLLTLLALSAVLSTSPALANEQAEAAFERATTQLRAGDLDAALDGFTAAAKADPANDLYRKRVVLLHRIGQIRAQLPRLAEDDVRWEASAQGLRTFYLQYGVYGEAADLDERRFARTATPAVRVDLAESCLEAGRDGRVVELLGALEEKHATRRSDLFLGVALARTGELERARGLAARVATGADGDPALVLEAACLNALLGNLDRAVTQVRFVYESVPAASHPSLQEYVASRTDLDALRVPKYEAVFATKSKVQAAGCEGCPSAGSCGPEKQDDDGCGDEAAGDCGDAGQPN